MQHLHAVYTIILGMYLESNIMLDMILNHHTPTKFCSLDVSGRGRINWGMATRTIGSSDANIRSRCHYSKCGTRVGIKIYC